MRRTGRLSSRTAVRRRGWSAGEPSRSLPSSTDCRRACRARPTPDHGSSRPARRESVRCQRAEHRDLGSRTCPQGSRRIPRTGSPHERCHQQYYLRRGEIRGVGRVPPVTARPGRSRRRRVSRRPPAGAGAPAREELAALAGVTVSWIAKLEQGNAHAVSPEVLSSVAGALSLNDAERAHLYALAGYRLDDARDADTNVTATLRTLLDALDPNPAYLLDRAWNIIAWNESELWLFPPSCARSRRRRRTCSSSSSPTRTWRDSMADHDEEMVRLVSQFRFHCTDWPQDPQIARVVTHLRDMSPAFVRLWDAKDVSPFITTRRVFAHPTAGNTRVRSPPPRCSRTTGRAARRVHAGPGDRRTRRASRSRSRRS